MIEKGIGNFISNSSQQRQTFPASSQARIFKVPFPRSLKLSPSIISYCIILFRHSLHLHTSHQKNVLFSHDTTPIHPRATYISQLSIARSLCTIAVSHISHCTSALHHFCSGVHITCTDMHGHSHSKHRHFSFVH